MVICNSIKELEIIEDHVQHKRKSVKADLLFLNKTKR